MKSGHLIGCRQLVMLILVQNTWYPSVPPSKGGKSHSQIPGEWQSPTQFSPSAVLQIMGQVGSSSLSVDKTKNKSSLGERWGGCRFLPREVQARTQAGLWGGNHGGVLSASSLTQAQAKLAFFHMPGPHPRDMPSPQWNADHPTASVNQDLMRSLLKAYAGEMAQKNSTYFSRAGPWLSASCTHIKPALSGLLCICHFSAREMWFTGT